MKKVLWAGGGLFVLLVAAVLIVPSFINWNEFKGEITDRAKVATGRHLEILGDIKIGIFPSPAVRLEQVRVANIEGASTTDMVSLKRLEVRVALVPLLAGEVQVRSIKLVEPVINIEILKDGRSNLVFSPTNTAPGGQPGGTSEPEPTASGGAQNSGASAIRIDDLMIENATIVYRDGRSDQLERIDNLNGRLAARSLTGPMETSGSAVVRGVPLSFEASVGAIVQGRTVPFTADVEVIPGEMKTRLSGSVSGLPDAPRFKGKLDIKGKDLGAFVAAVAKGAALPEALNRPFGVGADIQGNQTTGEVSNIIATLAKTQATGGVKMTFGKELGADIELAINHIDLDGLLKPAAAPVIGTPPTGDSKNSQSEVAPKASAKLAPRRAAPATGDGLAGFTLPANVNANLNLVVEALTFRQAPIRQAKLSATLAGGEITLSQLSALFPGGSDIAVFGVVATGPKGPSFDGNLDFTSNDLRSVVKWLGLPKLNVPADRLRKLKLAGNFEGNPSDIKITDINVRLDNTSIKGAANLALRDRPAFGANLVVDRINLDGYMPTGEGSASPSKPAGAPTGQAATTPSANQQANPLAGLAALAGFDANVKAKIRALTVRGLPARNVELDATLFGGNISIRKFNVADIAGLAVGVAGGINGFARSDGAVRPSLKNFQFRLNGKNIGRFAKLSGLKLPVSAARLGAIKVTTRLDGDLQKLQTTSKFQLAGGVFDISGTLAPLAVSPRIDARIALKHPSLLRLLRLAGIAYRPAKSRIGGVEWSGQLQGDLRRLQMSNFKSKIGSLTAAGTIAADLAGPRPMITADLKTGVIVVDDFLPAKQRTDTRHLRPRIIPATWQPLQRGNPAQQLFHRIANHVKGRWPTDRLDLSALRTVNADLSLKSAGITFDKIRVDNSVVVARLQNGVLQTRQLTGTVFGGAMTGRAQIDEDGRRSRYQSRLSIKNLDVARAMRATGAGTLGSGRMTMAVDLSSAGGSVADIVGALNGAGSFGLTQLDVRGASRGSALAPILDLISGLNQFAGSLSSKGGKGLAEIAGSFKMDRGIANFSDLRLTSNVGNGTAQGSVDLPNWQINSRGKIELAQNLLVQLLAQKTNAAQVLPFSVSGRLDAPNVKLETASLPNRGLPIPQKLLNKKGVGQLLQGILGGGRAPSAPPPATTSDAQPPPPPLEQQQKTKKPKVEDVLKGILRGLGR